MLADVITAALVTHRGQAGVSPLNSELHDLTSAYLPCPVDTRFDISVRSRDVQSRSAVFFFLGTTTQRMTDREAGYFAL